MEKAIKYDEYEKMRANNEVNGYTFTDTLFDFDDAGSFKGEVFIDVKFINEYKDYDISVKLCVFMPGDMVEAEKEFEWLFFNLTYKHFYDIINTN